jgi:hypothetical protein
VKLCTSLKGPVAEVPGPHGVISGGIPAQRLDCAVVSRVLAEVFEPEQRRSLALEDIGNPAERVVEVPDGDADTLGHLHARRDDLW